MKKILIFLVACLTISLFSSSSLTTAYEFSDEDINYYIDFCSKPLTNQNDAYMCADFKVWLKERADNYHNLLDELAGNISNLEGQIDEMGYQLEVYRQEIDNLSGQITALENSIAIAEDEIYQLEIEIASQEEEIRIRDEQIKQRMVDTQSYVGVNAYIEVIMGASNLVDLIRRVSVLQDITQFEQEEIRVFNQIIDELNMKKSETQRLAQQMEDDQEIVQKNRETAAYQQVMVSEAQATLRAQVAELLAQKREAEAAEAEILNSIPYINTQVFDALQGNTYFTHPMGGSYYVSAGTWAYPTGSLHLGIDYACSVGTPIVAPANGIILYAGNGYSTTGGYLGNWIGWPAGGGNTISLVGVVNGITYMFSFFHLANSPWFVAAGQSVTAGQQIAASGHSGNSTGPHLHFEVINMGTMTVEQVYNQFRINADFSGGTGWSSTYTACSVRGYTPCRERPEDLGF